MNKKLLIGILGLLIVVGVIYGFSNSDREEKEVQVEVKGDYKNIEYVKDSKYFGNELKTDLNDDGREDVVFIITQQPGGSGTFYYVVAAINTENGYVGSDAVLLGDRIAPQTIEKGKGKIVIVNYADRAQGEPFTTKPSVGKSIWLLLDTKTMKFGEVAQNFEGEAILPNSEFIKATGDPEAKIMARGDINNDGYEDAILQEMHCGASCGFTLDVVFNDQNKKAVLFVSPSRRDNFAPAYLGSSAAKSQLTSITIKDGIISLTGNGLACMSLDTEEVCTEEKWRVLKTAKYKFDGKEIVQISVQ